MLVDMGNPLGIRNPHGYGFGQNFIPVTGMGFLAGVFFLRGYGFGQVIPSGFLPIAISSREKWLCHGCPLVWVSKMDIARVQVDVWKPLRFEICIVQQGHHEPLDCISNLSSGW
jgi:hypothetical protein